MILCFGGLPSPFFRDTLPGACARARFEVMRHTTVVTIRRRLKNIALDNHTRKLFNGSRSCCATEIDPVNLTLTEIAHQLSSPEHPDIGRTEQTPVAAPLLTRQECLLAQRRL